MKIILIIEIIAIIITIVMLIIKIILTTVIVIMKVVPMRKIYANDSNSIDGNKTD